MTQLNAPGSSATLREDRMHDALSRIEGRLARLEAHVGRVAALDEQAPALLATLGDSFDDKMAQLQAEGVDIDARLATLLSIVERLTRPSALRMAETLLFNLEALDTVLESGILAQASLAAVGRAGAALAQVESSGPPRETGAWTALRALSDRDVQRALGFILEFARRFGQSLETLPVAVTDGARSGAAA